MSYLKISVKDNFSAALMKKLHEAGPKAAHAVAVQVEKDTEPFVPASQSKSLATRTQVVDGSVIYPGPYARYLYNGRVMVFEDPPYLRTVNGKAVLSHYGQKKKPIEKPVNPKAQAHWFEASKAQNLEKWEKKAAEAIDRELDK